MRLLCSAKREFARGSQSDHLAVLYAYNKFDQIYGEQRYQFARDNFLGVKTLQAISQLKRQLLETLSHAGLVQPVRGQAPAPVFFPPIAFLFHFPCSSRLTLLSGFSAAWGMGKAAAEPATHLIRSSR